MIKALAPISAEPNRLVRLFLSAEHRRAADMTAQWMRKAGLSVTEDALGTLRGRVGEGPRLLIGSHLDSVVDGGNYDGPLGSSPAFSRSRISAANRRCRSTC
jgi:allantoate deiminase